MNDSSLENWENRIRAAASEMAYPPTPEIAGQVRRRLKEVGRPRTTFYPRVAWAAVILVVLLLATILLVPPVRAAVMDFLQIGAVRIFLIEPTSTPSSTPAPPTVTPVRSVTPLPTAIPSQTPLFLLSLLDLQGETTLDQALERLHFNPSLPAYPTDLGDPDRVFLQSQGGQVLIMVWTDPQHPNSVRLSLHTIGPGSWSATKIEPATIEHTLVNGLEALWAEGPYPLQMTNGDMDIRRLVDGRVLIWEQDGLTYRLESDLTMEEAVKIAESLTPISQ